MHAIEAPIEVGQNGPDVANLQDGLQLLLERQIIRALDPPDSPTAEELADLAAKLREEQTESFYGDATQRLVQIVQLQQGLGDNLMGAVEKTTAIVLNRLLTKLGAFDGGGGDTPFSVQGQVTLPGGGAAVGYIVRAVDRDLRSLQPLGTDALTDTNGHYEIRYSSAQFAAADHGGADLVVRVFAADRGGKDRLLVESATMFNAAEAAEINLQIPDTSVQRSEFKLHVNAIVPLLAGQDDDGTAVPIAALKDPDISFLAADTGIERQHIAWLATAFRYSARTAAPDPERHVAQAEGSVAAALFYGWFREGLPDDWEQLIEQSIGVLRTAALAAIEHDIIPAGLAAALESSLDSMPNPQRDALRAAVTATGLGDDTAGTILRRAGAVAEVTNGLVAKLVDEGQLASADAHRAGLGLAAHALVDGDEAAMAAIVGATLSGRGDRGLRRARDLAALDVADIERAFADAGVEPPAGQTPAGYAARIAGQIAAIFPTDAMLHRVTTVTDEVVGAVRRVIAGGNKGAPDRPGSPAANEPSLQAFINLHPGLGLGSVIGAATDVGSAVATIRERVGWVDSVRELNPDLDLLAVDYLPDSESLGQVSFADLPDEARSMVIADLKAYQRIQAVGAGALDGIALLQAGLGSASALALREPAEIAEQTGIPITLARSYAQQAEDKADQTALTWFALYALERDAQVIKQFSFLQPPEYLKKLTGYNELFGSADFCDCENCRSVLGPAAYFVDLMHWVERHILTGSFNAVGGEANDLHPRSRRPDLWTLELTCDNTNLVVPALDLVIAMLEQFIVKQKRLASADALYDQLATVDYSIRLPFSLPVEQLSIFLSHLGITRAQIAEAFLLGSGDADSRARVRLGMVSKEFDIITNSRLGDPPSPAAIRAAEAFFSLWLGGVNLTFSVIPGETETRPLDPISILSFTKAAGLELGVVSEVLASSFVNGTAPGAPAPIQLEAGIGTPGGVQNDTERVLNLTSGRLDRFERLVRLWRHVPWTLAELDHVLVRLQHAAQSAPNQFDGPMVDRLAQLLDLQDKLHLPVDELCALWDALPVSALRGEAALFDRAFNLPSFVRQGGRWPAEDHFFDGTAGERARLVAAMQISDADLTLLLTGLSGCLTAGGQASKTFALGERNLSLLYRHARLAQVLKLSMDDLLQTVALTESITSKQAPTERCILTLDDLQAVVEVHAWRIASGFSIPEIHFITGTVSTLDGYDPPDDIATRLAAEIMAEKSLEITQDLFTQIGLTQAQSAEIIKGNSRPAGGISALLEPVPGAGAFRVARAIGLGDVATGLVFDPDPAPDMIAGFARDLYAIVQRAGDSGFEASGLEVLGLSEAGAAQLVQANVSSGAADGRPFEAVPGSPTHYRLRAAVDQGTAVAAFGAGQDDILAVKSAVRHRAVDLVTRHHAVSVLAAKASAAVKVSPEKTLALLNLVMPTTPAQRSALVDAVQGGPLQPFSAVLDALMRTAVLFRNGAYDAPALAFIGAHPTPWAMSDPRTAETVRRVGLYAKLAASPDRAYQPEAAAPDADALRSVLAMPASIATAAGDQARLTPIARALNSDVAAVGGALSRIALAAGNAVAPRLDELSHLAGALALTGRLGVPAEILRLAVSDSTSELTRAADGVFAAVRAKYPDEATFTEKLEPFIDKLRSRNRDGLVEYLLSAPDDVWRRRFATTSDLYHYFLTDVMVEGCARTSKVVAAISTIQLYVQRVLMNLEQSDEIPPQVTARLEDPDKLQPEWAWRKNYQVWVANRKVFLYPENYIEPGLRDDKTPLFKELEDVLLQQPITEQNVLDVYAKYLHGFDEVARLRVAGAYHDRSDASMDVLHLFGVTASEPPVYYYRTISSLEPPAAMPARPTRPVFSPWTKLDLQIPARRISPIVLHGRLYVFWVETTTRQKTDFKDGALTFTGYRHSVRSKFSYLRLDGRWTPPETLKIADSTGDVLDTRLIEDYLVQDPFLFDAFDKNGRPIRTINAKDDPDPLREKAQFGHDYEGGSVLPVQWAQWDAFSRKHTVPIETYVPGGWKWERIYPSVVGSGDGARIALEFAPRTDQAPPAPETVDLWSARVTPDPTSVELGYDLFPIVMPLPGSGVRMYLTAPLRATARLPFFSATSSLNDQHVLRRCGPHLRDRPVLGAAAAKRASGGERQHEQRRDGADRGVAAAAGHVGGSALRAVEPGDLACASPEHGPDSLSDRRLAQR